MAYPSEGRKVLLATTEPPRLLPSERQQRIRQLAAEHSVLRVSDLAETFGVSEMTVRRDLETLSEAGHLERTFGGAVATDQAAFESSYRVRLHTQTPQKTALARYAAALVQDGDTVAIDASTTSLALAHALARRAVTVVTNSLDSAQALRAGEAKVLLTGGYLRQVAGSFAGPLALRSLRDLRVDHAFISAKGLVLPDGLMDTDLDEIEVKRAMISAAARVTALVDSSKLGTRALGCIAPLEAFDLLITDSGLDRAAQQELEARDLELHVIDVEGEPFTS